MARSLVEPSVSHPAGSVEPGPNEEEIARLARSDQTSWWVRGRRTLVSEVLRAQARPGTGLVGDLGCGAGGMLEPLREFGEVVGIDISPLAAELCRSKGYRALAVGMLERLPLSEDTLALTGMTDVLEHVEDDERVIRECLRVLKPGGVLLITVPALRWLYGEHDRALGHFRRYSRTELRRLLERCGFHVERITYFNTLLLPLVVAFRLLSAFRREVRPQADPLVLANPWNWLAYQILLLERAIIRFLNLPVGVSLLCVVRKPAAGRGDRRSVWRVSEMTGESSRIDAGPAVQLRPAALKAAPRQEAPVREGTAISSRAVLARAGALLLLAVAAGVTYGIAPLYTSNQNQYFFHGLVRAGVGLLREDWLAQTADPTPVFSGLVAVTQQYLHPGLFYAYYLALAGVYVASLVGITRHVVDPGTTRGGLAAYLVLLLSMHSALLSRVSLDMVGLDIRMVLTSGVAGQSILGDYLQPSAFGVLLATSVYLFVRGRALPATVTAALAAVVHPTYLVPAGLLVCAYLLVTYRENRSPRSVTLIGFVALAPVLPIVVYVYHTFRPTSPESLAAAQNVLMHVRLSHHLLIDRWLNLSAYTQIAIVAAGLYAARRTHRLFPVLVCCAVGTVALTVAQALSGSASLALLFPWRLSVLLVPICSSVLAAGVASWVRDRATGHPARDRVLVWSSGVVAAILVMAGVAVTTLDARDYRHDPSLPVMNFVRETKAAGDVYLVPINLERFRLYTGAPIFIDRKSIPYRDVELGAWFERYKLGREFHLINDPDLACQALAGLQERYMVTHVVLRRGQFDGRCRLFQKLYDGGEYGVYRLVPN